MKYEYKATTRKGEIIEGAMEAKSHDKVVDHLHQMGYIPLRITGEGESDKAEKAGIKLRPSRKSVLDFAQSLYTLLDSGMPMDYSLGIIRDIEKDRYFRDVLSQVLKDVEGGSSLADALARHPSYFNNFFVSMVRAGEASGALEGIMGRLVQYIEKAEETKRGIISSVLYPVILVVVGILSIILIATFVVPRLSVMFKRLGVHLPLPARILMWVSDVLRYDWYIILAVIISIAAIAVLILRTEKARYRLDRIKLSMPIVGALIKNIEIGRFARTFSTLLSSGVPALEAIGIVKQTVTNRVLADSIQTLYEGMKKGEGISGPLRDDVYFPPLAVSMISVGEESGRLEEVMAKIADRFEADVRHSLERMLTLLGPLIIIFMAVIIGGMILTMALTILSVNEITI